jgi:hypothetical protein
MIEMGKIKKNENRSESRKISTNSSLLDDTLESVGNTACDMAITNNPKGS